ncbi:hypothetical protein CC2G_012062 [Coprinopsis cinerea AmutBmut pab1-1]|nr:hypothetical protein CC2G_012062 [Coprinopsis cinerea AmutBmut pab1-1]
MASAFTPEAPNLRNLVGPELVSPQAKVERTGNQDAQPPFWRMGSFAGDLKVTLRDFKVVGLRKLGPQGTSPCGNTGQNFLPPLMRSVSAANSWLPILDLDCTFPTSGPRTIARPFGLILIDRALGIGLLSIEAQSPQLAAHIRLSLTPSSRCAVIFHLNIKT